MGVLVISSLLLKRQREKPKRPWRIWCVRAFFAALLGYIPLQVVRRVQADSWSDVRAWRECRRVGFGLYTDFWERVCVLLSQHPT
jgi:hypothetical protein